jgi:hypothetical protein
MALLGVRANDEKHVVVLDLGDRVRHCTGAEYGGQTGYG